MPLRAARRRTGPQTREGFRAVGRVERPWGLRGHLKVLPLTDFPERFAPGARVFLNGQARTVVSARWQKGRVYLEIHGVSDEAAADALRGLLLEVPEAERAPLAADEFYLDEIEGCRVYDRDGDLLGTVREVLRPGANDVYVVARPGQRDLLLPAIHEVIVEVDVERRRLVVELLEGLDPELRRAGTD